jgi:hypothetical protein
MIEVDSRKNLGLSFAYALLVSVVTFLGAYGSLLAFERAYIAIFVLGVAFCCWQRDWRSGVMACGLGLLGVAALLPPAFSFTVDDAHDIARMITFTVLAALVCTFSVALERRSGQLHLAQRRQRLSEQWLDKAQETARFWTWELDADRRFMKWVNPYGTLASREYAPVEMVIQRLHPDDRIPFIRAVEAARSSGEFALEFRVLEDQRVRWIMARGSLDKEHGGARLLGISMDMGKHGFESESSATLAGLEDLLHTIESSRRLDPDVRMSVALARDILLRLRSEEPAWRQRSA